MKIVAAFLTGILFTCCAEAKETSYTASTPAGAVIRSFLGIVLTDSIDFIRWKCTLNENSYTLSCNYGISKPNTNGFINDGKKINLTGKLAKEKNYYRLYNGNKLLKLVELNNDLLHLLDDNNNLLVGNGGWSYTLNNTAPAGSDETSLTANKTVFKDSLSFEGRTPCYGLNLLPPGTTCYKLKWYLILYSDATKQQPGTYRIYGTPWRKAGSKTGNWQMVIGKNKRIIYQLNDEKGNGFLYLLKLDEHVLVFTDANGKLLTGDEDFSFTLNRFYK